jgi:hypothetical protein
MKPFWKSKKFIYALATLIAALIVALLPSVTTLDAQTDAMLRDVLPGVLAMGIAVIAGHTLTDVTAIWFNRPIHQPLATAAHAMIDAAGEALQEGGAEGKTGDGLAQ